MAQVRENLKLCEENYVKNLTSILLWPLFRVPENERFWELYILEAIFTHGIIVTYLVISA